ncbi:MAG: hypothetical protein H0X24_00750 [Ktedonobacterales bacterium]|nr:hypothetical protein [Ktedonobacterales bacterium]
MPYTNDEISEAEQYLRGYPEFDWLTKSGQQWFKTQEVSDGLGIGEAAVRAICDRQEIDGAINYGKPIGWRMPRAGLFMYLATLKRRGAIAG